MIQRVNPNPPIRGGGICNNPNVDCSAAPIDDWLWLLIVIGVILIMWKWKKIKLS